MFSPKGTKNILGIPMFGPARDTHMGTKAHLRVPTDGLVRHDPGLQTPVGAGNLGMKHRCLLGRRLVGLLVDIAAQAHDKVGGSDHGLEIDHPR